jgi:hypothetical protein
MARPRGLLQPDRDQVHTQLVDTVECSCGSSVLATGLSGVTSMAVTGGSQMKRVSAGPAVAATGRVSDSWQGGAIASETLSKRWVAYGRRIMLLPHACKAVRRAVQIDAAHA